MKKSIFLFSAIVLFSSHDMFLKMDSFFLSPNVQASLHLYNGTFEESDNVITRDRMIDVSLVGNGDRQRVDTSMWTEMGDITVLKFKTGSPGTWVAGMSSRARNIELSAKDFNNYLEHDGVLDMIEKRKQDGTESQAAIEKYSKHVKAIFQVGDVKSDDWKTTLGYPIEFVPQNNPYELGVGGNLQVKLLRAGQPLADQLVYSGFNGGGHSHSNEEEGASEEAHHHDEQSVRTNANGIANVKIDHGGQWYIRTIHMVTTEEPGLTHESNWATLTFEVSGPLHGVGIPQALYWIGGIVLILGIFLYFKQKRKS